MPNPTTFSYTIMDDQGLKNSTDFYVAYDGLTATEDELVNGWLAYGALLDLAIDGQIIGGAITIPLDPDAGWKATPNNGNNVNQVLVENFNNDSNHFATAILLPSYRESVLTNKVPNITSGALKNFNDLVLAGTPAVTPAIFPNSSSLHDVNSLRDAFLTVRKVRKNRVKTRVTP